MIAAVQRVEMCESEEVRPSLEVLQGTSTTRPVLVNSRSIQSEYVDSLRAVWMYMNHVDRPCFTPELIGDIVRQQTALGRSPEQVDFLVTASAVPGIFNLGGDLALFRQLVLDRDRDGLLRYATNCVDGVHNFSSGCGAGVVTIALIEGDALGGGFEAALACNIVVAERGAKMGFPELLFNLFPGMGALSFVARKAGPRVAEELITTGKILVAEQMHELGLVDYLAEPGEGEAVVRKVIAQRRATLHGYRAYQKAKQHSYLHVPYEELLEITRVWVDAACSIAERDLKVMDRLVRAQDKRAEAA